MPGMFRDQAVALLARERLHEIRDLLRAKRQADPARWSAIEARVLYLAEQATAVTNGAPGVRPERFPGVFHTAPGETTSKFFTMGALGTTIPGFGSLFAPDQDWVYRVLRKGTRDERRERVDAQSARLAVEMFRRARGLIEASTMSDADKTAAIAAARAFFLGQLCHVASGVIGAPLLDDMTWSLPGPPVTTPTPLGITGGTDAKLSRDNVEAQIDQLLKDRLLQPSIVGSTDFASWLPSAREVPDPLYQAFADTIRDLYLGGDTHKGFADLEAAFSSQAPEVSKDWIAEGFSTLRNVMGSGHDWGFWTWISLLTPLAVPSLITVPLTGQLPKGKDVGLDAVRGDERAWWEVFALQYAGTGLILPFYVLLFNAFSYRGFSQEGWLALVLGLIVLGFSIALLARLGEQDSAGARWTLLAVPVVLELFFAFIYIPLIRHGGGRYNRLFAAMFALHIVITLLNVAYLAIPQISNDLRDGGGAAFGWWLLYALVGVPLLVLLVPALILRALGSFSLDAGAANAFLSEPRFARLFDDSTLVSDPGAVSPTLAQHYYPPGDADGMRRMRRKLMALWWHGGTKDLYVRSRGDRLELKWVATGVAAPGAAATADQIVELPQAAMSVRVFAALLGQVREPAAGPGVLEVQVAAPEDEDHLLPEGRVLALGFEDDFTRAQVARLAAGDAWAKIGDHPPPPPPDPDTGVIPPIDDPGVPIFFATKARLSVAFGAHGEATDPDEPAGVASAALTGTITQGPGGPTSVLGTNTRFIKELAAGDLLQVGANQAVIDQILDDSHLVVSAPATWLPALGGGAVAFARFSDDRRYDRAGTGLVFTHAGAGALPVPFPPSVSAVPLVIGNAATTFDRLFRTGDVIRVLGPGSIQERVVVRVLSATAMQVDSPFSIAIDTGGAGSPFVRVGRHGAEGKRFFGTAATDLFSGDSAMDDAADLAALLCLGGVSHVLTDAERQPVSGTTTRFPGPQPIGRVYQCFRNWNLDRRRVNEWKMLVAGRAISEKRGRPIVEPDSMMIPPEDGYNPVNPGGEAVALELGWVGLLRRWMDVARRGGVDAVATSAFRPGDPTNLALSRGLAFLLDLPDPAPGVE